jgi:hypothetical protein
LFLLGIWCLIRLLILIRIGINDNFNNNNNNNAMSNVVINTEPIYNNSATTTTFLTVNNMPDDLPTYENAMKSKVVCKKY